ncbi:unnamed protein product, partial [Allacma fusca]
MNSTLPGTNYENFRLEIETLSSAYGTNSSGEKTESDTANDNWTTLPIEVLSQIFSHLDLRTKQACRLSDID